MIFQWNGSPVTLLDVSEFEVDAKIKYTLEHSSDLDELTLKDMKELAISAHNVIKSIDDECTSVEIEDKCLEDDED